MQTSSSAPKVVPAPSVIPEAGEPVLACQPEVDQIVFQTAMRANFMVRGIFDFCQADLARQEQGIPDDLLYLSRAMAMVMSVASTEQYFAEICREQKSLREQIVAGIQSSLQSFQDTDVPDTSALQAQANSAYVHSKQLEVAASMHDSTVGEVAVVLDNLQQRVDALLQPAALGYVAGRRN